MENVYFRITSTNPNSLVGDWPRREVMRFLDRMTGRSVEKKLVEYSDIYGEILLGMHRDLEDHKRQVDALALRVERLRIYAIWVSIAVLILFGVMIVWILHFKR
jgi:hypothetical protein